MLHYKNKQRCSQATATDSVIQTKLKTHLFCLSAAYSKPVAQQPRRRYCPWHIEIAVTRRSYWHRAGLRCRFEQFSYLPWIL